MTCRTYANAFSVDRRGPLPFEFWDLFCCAASYLERGVLEERCKHYSFQGTLGDQDLYTLIAFDHPELFYTLPCTWNRQLCLWWKYKGYEHVFGDYFSCQGKIEIYHGNCKSVIPPLENNSWLITRILIQIIMWLWYKVSCFLNELFLKKHSHLFFSKFESIS